MAEKKLTDRRVQTAPAGMHSDGSNLYLEVKPTLSRSFAYIYYDGPKRTQLGLGPYPAISLALARQRAGELNTARATGVDPKVARDRWRGASITFGECGEEWLREKISGSSKSYRNWCRRALFVESAILVDIPIARISSDDIVRVLAPQWLTKSTAKQLQQTLEAFLSWAKTKKYREGENPAAWMDNLKHRLPKRVYRPKHHASMQYSDLPGFLAEMRARDDYKARAIEWQILTVTRPGEALGARWSEFDLPGRIWTVPAERMKMGIPHQIPLCDRALEILDELAKRRSDEYLLPFRSTDMLGKFLTRKLGLKVTPHGFRSTFREWAAARKIDDKVAEMCLAHKVGTETERAYLRSTLLQLRRPVMIAWADYCCEVPGKVITLRR